MSLRRRPKMESSIHNHHLIKIKIQTIFPEEIVTEILSRLPVKFLLKFRCVSKSWCTLISSKHFAKFHLANSRKDTKFTHHRIISTVFIPYLGCRVDLKSCSFHSLLHEPRIHAVDIDYPMKYPPFAVRIVGCCNGLVCIAVNDNRFFLLNPSTKEHKRLPDVDEHMERYRSITFGFGYDERNDDYKVVGIFSGYSSAWIRETMVKVYSLKTNSWNRIEVFKDGLPYGTTGKFVSGKLHWRGRNGSNSKWDIVYVDLNSEICGTVEQPTYTEGDFSWNLGVLGDCLCVLCDFPKLSLDVWVMKQYGVKETWDKIVTICYNDLCDPYSEYLYLTPLFIGPKGEVVLVCGSSFVLYDIGKRSFKRLKTVHFEHVLEEGVYVESLVSLVPGEPNWQN